MSITCRACGHVQESGKFCEQCSIALPVLYRKAPAADASAQASRVCRQCGIKTAAERCPACGMPTRELNPKF